MPAAGGSDRRSWRHKRLVDFDAARYQRFTRGTGSRTHPASSGRSVLRTLQHGGCASSHLQDPGGGGVVRRRTCPGMSSFFDSCSRAPRRPPRWGPTRTFTGRPARCAGSPAARGLRRNAMPEAVLRTRSSPRLSALATLRGPRVTISSPGRPPAVGEIRRSRRRSGPPAAATRARPPLGGVRGRVSPGPWASPVP